MGRVCDQDTSVKATSFFKLLTSFDFLSSFLALDQFTRHSVVAGFSNRYCWCNASYRIIEKTYLLQTQFC